MSTSTVCALKEIVWLRSYGPSPSGDAESLGYIVLDKLAGAPWLHPDLPAAKDLEAEMKILASCGCLNMTIFGTRECAWPEV